MGTRRSCPRLPAPREPAGVVAPRLPASRPVPGARSHLPLLRAHSARPRPVPAGASPAPVQPPPARCLQVVGEGVDHQPPRRSLELGWGWGAGLGVRPAAPTPGRPAGPEPHTSCPGCFPTCAAFTRRENAEGDVPGSGASRVRGARERRLQGPGTGAGAGPRMPRAGTQGLAQLAVTRGWGGGGRQQPELGPSPPDPILLPPELLVTAPIPWDPRFS